MRQFAYAICLAGLLPFTAAAAENVPEVGQEAKDFTLETREGQPVQLAKLRESGPVVVVVLRGYPGYQCPLCSKQVSEFTAKAKDFADANAKVVMIYPGEAVGLDPHAAEFAGKLELPEHFSLVLDPGYVFTKSWNLRWDEPNETAYPSTFIVDRTGTIQYAKVSKTHGGRSKVDEVLAALTKVD